MIAGLLSRLGSSLHLCLYFLSIWVWAFWVFRFLPFSAVRELPLGWCGCRGGIFFDSGLTGFLIR
jgi:hypothetical protein